MYYEISKTAVLGLRKGNVAMIQPFADLLGMKTAENAMVYCCLNPEALVLTRKRTL